MQRWLIVVTFGVAVAPNVARADGIAEEVGAGGVPSTPTSPGSGWINDKIAAMWDVNNQVQLRADVSATRVSGSTDATHGDVLLSSLATTYSIDDHWTIRVNGSWSPRSTTLATVPVDTQGLFAGSTQANAQLRAVASSLAVGGGLDYDTAGTSDNEISASISVNATYFTSQQAITTVQADTGELADIGDVRKYCRARACSSEIAGALWPQLVQLGQFALGASVTDTMSKDTDISLDASYFLYDSDPLQLGYFALATVGRSTLGSAAGVAPMQDSITPSAGHRWGNLGMTMSFTYGEYVANMGFDVGISLRVQYKFVLGGSHRLKVFGKVGVAWHVDATGDVGLSGSTGAGVTYSW